MFDDPVRGLSEGGEVRFNGIKIGEVESLRIDPDNTNRVIARIRVQSDVPVKNDTEGQLEPIGSHRRYAHPAFNW
ncbi:MAG: MCE family protein [Caulobacteraceae bacterium]|nr:MCE family protein [Caulobacteraceae bacterium]